MNDCADLGYDRIAAATPGAVLLVLDDDEGTEHWVPRSVIEDGYALDVTDEPGEVSVAEWFLVKEGLA